MHTYYIYLHIHLQRSRKLLHVKYHKHLATHKHTHKCDLLKGNRGVQRFPLVGRKSTFECKYRKELDYQTLLSVVLPYQLSIVEIAIIILGYNLTYIYDEWLQFDQCVFSRCSVKPSWIGNKIIIQYISQMCHKD